MTAPSRTKFYRDKQNGKWAGVCSGLADYTGVEALWIRIGFLVLTIAFGWPLLAYIAIAMLSPVKPIGLYRTPDEQKFWQGVRANPARGSRDVRASFRELDRRLADIELYYTSRNTRLADEIDALR
jgi:phage shock protein C